MSVIKECRICMGEELKPGDAWISPCACAGTLKWVHRSCIYEWVAQGAVDHDQKRTRCEICRHEYRLRRLNHNDLLFLRMVAVARPFNVSTMFTAEEMEDGRLDEILDFFIHTTPGFESVAPCLQVTIDNPSAWPESLPKQSAIDPREEQLADRLYKFQRYNDETGDKLEVEVHGSFGNIDDEGKGEPVLRVSEMVLCFRPDDTDK